MSEPGPREVHLRYSGATYFLKFVETTFELSPVVKQKGHHRDGFQNNAT